MLNVFCFALKVGVKIQLASNSLTKIVAFSPFFVLMNSAQVVLLFQY